MSQEVARPNVSFYAQALDQLERVGVSREVSQTPKELAKDAEKSLSHPLIPPVTEPLQKLTSTYYAVRFGDADEQRTAGEPAVETALAQLTQSVDLMVSSSKSESRS